MRRAAEPSYLILLRVGFAEHPGSPRGLVSSYLTGSPLPADRSAGGLISVALSPSRDEPPLAATLPCGVRTFLPAGNPPGDRPARSDILERGECPASARTARLEPRDYCS